MNESGVFADLLWEFDERLRGGESCSWNEYLRRCNVPKEYWRDAICDLVAVEAQHRGWEESWIAHQVKLVEIAEDAELTAAVLRSVYRDQVACGRRPRWSRFSSYGINALALDLREVGEPLALGIAVGQRYRVEQRVGEGSFAVVYRAADRTGETAVALKAGWCRSEEERQLTDRLIAEECRLLHAARGPGVPHVYGLFGWKDHPVLVTEFVEGQSLSAYQENCTVEDEEAARIVMAIGRVVERSHRLGHIHRDLKPDNIIVRDGGEVYVIDFGIGLREETQFSDGAARAGTLRYMAPEAIVQDVTRLDARTDIWSLGVILYELLAGERLFPGRTKESVWVEAVAGTCIGKIAAARIDPRFKDVLTRCFAFEPGDRFPTVASFVAAIATCLHERRR